MRIDYDPAKRATTLEVRGLDMAQAGEVFDGTTLEENRQDYGDSRFLTIGFLAGRMVVLVACPDLVARIKSNAWSALRPWLMWSASPARAGRPARAACSRGSGAGAGYCNAGASSR